MSVVPLLMNLARELQSPSLADWDWDVDDNFGYGIHPVDIFRVHQPHGLLGHGGSRRRHHSATPYDRWLGSTRRALRHAATGHKPAGSEAAVGGGRRADGGVQPVSPLGPDGFQVCIDVSQFKPNELTVKTRDNWILVEGRHEEREDEHGLIERHFVRKYSLPAEYDPTEVVSTVSSDGVLTVRAPPPADKALPQSERIVHIQQTGPAHLSIKTPTLKEGEEATTATATAGGALKSNGDKVAGATAAGPTPVIVSETGAEPEAAK